MNIVMNLAVNGNSCIAKDSLLLTANNWMLIDLVFKKTAPSLSHFALEAS